MTTLLEKYIAKVSEIPVQVDLGNRVFIDRSDIQSLLPELIKEVEESVICDNCHHYARYKK